MRIKALLLIAGLIISSPLLAEELAGVWTLTLDTPRGIQHPVLTINRNSDTYSGTYEGRQGPLAIESITRDGERFSFPLQISIPIGTIDVHYSGTFSDNQMTGVVANPRGEVPFTGARE